MNQLPDQRTELLQLCSNGLKLLLLQLLLLLVLHVIFLKPLVLLVLILLDLDSDGEKIKHHTSRPVAHNQTLRSHAKTVSLGPVFLPADLSVGLTVLNSP